MKLLRPVVVLDLETTGVWIEKDRITEIGMARLMPDGSRQTYLKRVNPGILIPAFVTKLTGISNEDVKDCPPFKSIAQAIHEFIGEADFGGFNVERFDLPLLEREFFDAGLRLDWRKKTVYDAQKIYHIHEKRDLKAAYKFYCGQELSNAHTALADTEAALAILEAQITRYGKGSDQLESLIDFDYEPAADFFDAERKFRWWNGQLYPVFGKYGRKSSIQEIATKEPAYLQYLATTDFGQPVKTMLREALQGNFPVQGH